MKPQFYDIRAAATNIASGACGSYTVEMFQADFPQFYTKADEATPATSLVPETMLVAFIAEANATISQERWGEGWRYTAGLYVAHQATLYLRTYTEGSDSPAQAAESGALVGVVKSAKLGDASVTYDTGAITEATADWGDLNATQYGQMLASRARLVGLGNSYVI